MQLAHCQNISPLFLSFLYEHHSPAYHFYKEKVQQFSASASRTSSSPAAEASTDLQSGVAPPLLCNPPPLSPASQQPSQEVDTPPVKRKRKSRWGAEDDKVDLPIPPIAVPQEMHVPDPSTPSLSGTWSVEFPGKLSFVRQIASVIQFV